MLQLLKVQRNGIFINASFAVRIKPTNTFDYVMYLKMSHHHQATNTFILFYYVSIENGVYSLSDSQVGPVYPAGQLQLNTPPLSKQVPPFEQGMLSQVRRMSHLGPVLFKGQSPHK